MTKRRSAPPTCERPDRDVPGIVCGYPLPCPWHTFVVDLGDLVSTLRSKKPAAGKKPAASRSRAAKR